MSNPDRCWCCGAAGIEHDPYLEVVAMDADGARAFGPSLGMSQVWKVDYVRQADAGRYKFGARVYRLFATPAAWVRYCTTKTEGADVA